LKKKLFLSSIATTLMVSSFSIGVLAAPKLSVWFNGKAKNVSVKIIDKKAYVPLTDAASWFGGKVAYDKKSNTYKVTSKDYHPSSNTVKSYNVNAVINSGPMKMTISKVTLDPKYKYDKYSSAIKALVMDVKVQNTSSNKLSWYPVQGIYALNTGEQIEDGIMYSENVDGDFLGKAYKSGKIVLQVKKSNLDSIKSLQISVDGAFSTDNWDQRYDDVIYNLKFR
jgi:hypothetical protein